MRSTAYTVIVAGDDEPLRRHTATLLGVIPGVMVVAEVVAAVMVVQAARFRPDLVVLAEHDLRIIDPARLRRLARPPRRHGRRQRVALLVDAPDLVRGPALAAGASAVWPTATDPTDLAGRLHELTGGALGAR